MKKYQKKSICEKGFVKAVKNIHVCSKPTKFLVNRKPLQKKGEKENYTLENIKWSQNRKQELNKKKEELS